MDWALHVLAGGLIVVFLAVGKEIYDQKTGGPFDIHEILYTLLGALIVALILLALRWRLK